MKSVAILFFSIIFLQASSQDLTGIWRGSFFTSRVEELFGSANRFEVQLDNVDRGVRGVSYSYAKNSFYGKSTLVGMWTAKTKNLIIKEDKLVDYKNAKPEDVAMFTCYLEYRKEGNKEILEGNYDSENYITHEPSGGGKIYLERVQESDFKKEDFIIRKEEQLARQKNAIKSTNEEKNKPKSADKTPLVTTKKDTPKNTPQEKTKPTIAKQNDKQQEPKRQTTVIVKKSQPATSTKTTAATPSKVATPKKADEPAKVAVKDEPVKRPTVVSPTELPRVLKERKNELVQTILTAGPEILIELYDNGEVDGDTISVYQNGRLIATHRGLSLQPITIKVRIDEDNPDQEIVMVAENLGTIPPNTALMIIKTGGNRYDLRISSSEQKNAMVKFRYQKE